MGGGGDGIAGEEGSPLASCSACSSLSFCLIQSFICLSLCHFFCLFCFTPCLDLGMSMGVKIPHGDAENMNEV